MDERIANSWHEFCTRPHAGDDLYIPLFGCIAKGEKMINKQIIRATGAAIGMSTLFAISPKANALPEHDVTTNCYSDPEQTQWIDSVHLDCTGHVQRRGTCNGPGTYYD